MPVCRGQRYSWDLPVVVVVMVVMVPVVLTVLSLLVGEVSPGLINNIRSPFLPTYDGSLHTGNSNSQHNGRTPRKSYIRTKRIIDPTKSVSDYNLLRGSVEREKWEDSAQHGDSIRDQYYEDDTENDKEDNNLDYKEDDTGEDNETKVIIDVQYLPGEDVKTYNVHRKTGDFVIGEAGKIDVSNGETLEGVRYTFVDGFLNKAQISEILETYFGTKG